MLTGTMFRELAQLAGTDAVLQFLTGYADDLTACIATYTPGRIC